MTPSQTHFVLLPSYNSGPRLREVVAEVLAHWQPVLLVIDGSDDGSEQPVLELARSTPALTVLRLSTNSGKGAAVLAGARWARERGFTHALVMDADGQHPAASIAEFMTESVRRPDAMVLGRPIFPPNIPPERLHGRKLSVGMVRLELLGAGIADALFGFRVYPLEPLLRELGPRRGGRRYDFDTEAAVRLAWSGVPPVNIPAPVRYFSREEGGISHFHYLRDNITLVGMHVRLLAELLWRWPILLGHRRRWRAAARLATFLLLLALLPAMALATPADFPAVEPIQMNSPAWADLFAAFAERPDTRVAFTERRIFPFRKQAVELAGQVRVSATRGLSLHYTEPQERIVVLDERGVLIRDALGERAPPADARAEAVNAALLHVLRFDFAALEKDFDLHGTRESGEWIIVMTARSEAMQRMTGRITVAGEGAAVHWIELWWSPRQSITITMSGTRDETGFTPEEAARFFR